MQSGGFGAMTDAERQRLLRILGMLGSSFAGERDNAARHAEAIRVRHGLTWEDLLALKSGAEPPKAPEAAEPPRDWNDLPSWSAYNETMPGIWERRWHRSVKVYHDASFLFLVGLFVFAALRGLIQGIKGFF
jgi:hypothetical protein